MEDRDDISRGRGSSTPGPKRPRGVDSGHSGGEDATAQMALFVLPDGVTLEVHVPGTREVRSGPSAAREAGFILRRGREVMNVGPLGWLLRGQGVDARGRLVSAGPWTRSSRRARRTVVSRRCRAAR